MRPDLRQDSSFACRDRLNHDISQPVSVPGFEFGTFRIESRMLPSIRPWRDNRRCESSQQFDA